MAIYSLDFLNKNMFRRFPFRAETSLTAVNGKKISNNLIVGMSITATLDRQDLYISQIFVMGNFIDLVLSCRVDGKNVSLGRFYGTVTEDYSVLYLEQFERFINGILILGSTYELSLLQGGYFFDPAATKLEDSTIFYYTPPKVKSVTNKENELRGRVEFGILTNLIKTKDEKNIKLSTSAGAQIASLADKSSHFKNCPTPLIYSINGAVPFEGKYTEPITQLEFNYPILDGNIYMIGIKPVVFYGEYGGTVATFEGNISGNTLTITDISLGKITVGNFISAEGMQACKITNFISGSGGVGTYTISTAQNVTSRAMHATAVDPTPILTKTVTVNDELLTLNDLCTARNKVLPPINPVYLANRPDEVTTTPTFKGKENYYTKSYTTPINFIKVNEPEFLSWPQFFKNFTKYIINAPIDTSHSIDIPANHAGGSIKRIVLRNSSNGQVGATITVSIKINQNTLLQYSSLIVAPNQAIIVNDVQNNLSSPASFVAEDKLNILINAVQGNTYNLQVIIFYR
jgi:hypothetical protein